ELASIDRETTMIPFLFFFFSSRRRHTRWPRDWSSDVCSSDLDPFDIMVRKREPLHLSKNFRPEVEEKLFAGVRLQECYGQCLNLCENRHSDQQADGKKQR